MLKKKRSKIRTSSNANEDSLMTAEEMDVEEFLNGGFEALTRCREAMSVSRNSMENMNSLSSKTESGRGAQANGQGALAQRANVKASAMLVKEELKSHKAQLDSLQTADPEFFEYLKASDKTLLDFSDGDDDLEARSDGRTDELTNRHAAAADLYPSDNGDPATRKGYVDTALVESACAEVKEHPSMGSFRNILSLYRSACHYGDPNSDTDEAAMGLRIASDGAFQRILVFTLSEADSFFRQLLSVRQLPGFAIPSGIFKSSKWRKVKPLLKSYMGNTLHLLTHLAEENSSMFILRRLRASAAFLAPFEALRKKMQKHVAGLFGSSQSHQIRLQALLWLREIGLTCEADGLSAVLRTAYRTFAAHSNFVSSTSLPHIAFMVSGLVELYGIDLSVSYEASLLRDALTMKTADAFREVYCWRAINCLELWGRMVAAHADRNVLTPLVYPVVQLLLAAARLVPSSRWFPVRLRLARILNAVAAATQTFVPVVPLLLEILAWPGFSNKVSGTGKNPDLTKQLRLSKANLKLSSVQQEVVEQTMELLAGSLALSARNPGFPELAYLPTLSLKRFINTTQAEKFRSQAKLLLHVIDENSQYVGMRRDGAEFAPKDSTATLNFLKAEPDSKIPLLAYAKRLAEKGAHRLAQNDAVNPIAEDASGQSELGNDVKFQRVAGNAYPAKQNNMHPEPEGNKLAIDMCNEDVVDGSVLSDEDLHDPDVALRQSQLIQHSDKTRKQKRKNRPMQSLPTGEAVLTNIRTKRRK